MAEIKGKRRGRWRKQLEPDVIDLRVDETIDLSSPAPEAEYHCMRVWHNVPSAPDPVQDAWASSASLVEYSADLDELSSDRRRDTLAPGPQLAVEADLEVDDEFVVGPGGIEPPTEGL